MKALHRLLLSIVQGHPVLCGILATLTLSVLLSSIVQGLLTQGVALRWSLLSTCVIGILGVNAIVWALPKPSPYAGKDEYFYWIVPLGVVVVFADWSLATGQFPQLSGRIVRPEWAEGAEVRIHKVEAALGKMAAEAQSWRASKPPTYVSSSTLVGVSAATVESSGGKVRALEQLVLKEPDRVITIPLLQKDLDAVRAELSSLRREHATVNQTVTWGFGLLQWVLGTVLVAILGLVGKAAADAIRAGGQTRAAESARSAP